MIVDAHNDLLLELDLERDAERPFATRWLPKLLAGGVALQVCPIYTADQADPAAAARAARDAFERALEESGGAAFAVRSRDDLELLAPDRVGLMLAFEGAEPLGGDPDAFGEWWDAGVRMVSLTWNEPTAFAGGTASPERGLSDRGRELVTQLVERGAVVDLAHASDRTFWDVLEHAPEANIVVSHACCRAVNDHPRNVTDEQLRALAAVDGVLGVMALALMVGSLDVDRWVDHVEHATNVMGDGHVGIGADWIDQVTQAQTARGIPQNPSTIEALESGGGILGLRGATGPEHYPALVDALRARGFAGARLDWVTHESLLRLLSRALR